MKPVAHDSPARDAAPHEPRVRRARAGLIAVFFVNGLVYASWMPQIPTLRADLGLSDAMLGLALLGPPVGFLAGTNLTGRLVSRFGSSAVTRGWAALYCLCLLPPAFAAGAGTLFALLIPLGLSQGSLVVASNAHGAVLQRRYGRPIMAMFHAFYSMGGMAGAGLGGLAAHRDVDPRWHFAAVSLAGTLCALVATRFLLPRPADGHGDHDGARHGAAAPRRRTGGPVLLLSVLGFFVLMAEGETANWSAIYLKDVTGAGDGLAAAGYVAFAAMMTAGRLTGDRLVARFGPVRVVRVSAGLGAAGMALALLAGTTAAGIAGFAVLGLGLSGLIPILFSAAANVPGTDPDRALAQVVALSFLGFLAGPPLMGVIAEVSSPTVGFALLAALIAAVSLAARAAAPAARGAKEDPA
jgi:fucose permease